MTTENNTLKHSITLNSELLKNLNHSVEISLSSYKALETQHLQLQSGYIDLNKRFVNLTNQENSREGQLALPSRSNSPVNEIHQDSDIEIDLSDSQESDLNCYLIPFVDELREHTFVNSSASHYFPPNEYELVRKLRIYLKQVPNKTIRRTEIISKWSSIPETKRAYSCLLQSLSDRHKLNDSVPETTKGLFILSG